MTPTNRAGDAEQDYAAHDAGHIVSDIEEVDVVDGIELHEHSRDCDERPPHSSWRWWTCPKCERNVDTFGGSVA